jgi:hypothetical protein
MTNIPMRWYEDLGWVINVEKGMTPQEIERCIDFTLKVQTDRFVSLPPGDRKDECLRTIGDLKAKRVQVNIGGTGERVLFDAYKQQKRFWYPELVGKEN